MHRPSLVAKFFRQVMSWGLAVAWFAVVAVPPGMAKESGDRPPNIIIIMADDLGYGDLSSYDGWIETPALDRLARQGIRLTDFHSSGNVCSPTRAGLMTGRYQQRAGIPGVVFADPKRAEHKHGLQPEEVTVAEVFRQGGYATAIFGKWHLGYEPKYNPTKQGFDIFRGYVSGNIDFFSHIDQAGALDWWHDAKINNEPGYTTHLITRYAVEFIEEHQEKPFFLYLPHEAPHYPYQGPHDEPVREEGNPKELHGKRTDVKEAYREMVVEMDHGVAKVLETLDRLELSENTLVWFFSDNGANARGSNGVLRGFKGSNWEGGHRVPSIASWPGRIPAGTVNDSLSISLDVMPTTLSLAGIELPAERKLDGKDVSPMLIKNQVLPSRQLFWNGQAMRDGNWKLIVNGRVRKKNVGKEKLGLYNVAQDRGEMNNLADKHPDRVKSMLAALVAWRNDVAQGATEQP